MNLTESQKKKIIELRNLERPMSYLDISFEVGVNAKEVGTYCKEIGLNKNKNYGIKPGTIRLKRKNESNR